MLPTSIAGSISIAAPPGGQVAGLDRADVQLFEAEVATGLDPDQVRVRAIRPAEVAAALNRRVLDDRHLRADGPDEAGRSQALLDLLRRGLARRLPQSVCELDLVQPVVTADQREHEPALRGDHRNRLQRGSLWNAERPGDLGNRGHARGRRLAGLVEAGRQLDRLGGGRGDLDVGGIAGRERHLVLARGARRHVLVGAGSRPSSRRRPRPGTSAGRCGRRCGRRRRCAARRRGPGPRRRGRSCRSPSS